jgi:pyridoxal phosphate enzyme (YggS family)
MEHNDQLFEQICANLEQVWARIARARSGAGRGADAVQVVVVTKTHPAWVTAAALQAADKVLGAGNFALGENYAEEAVRKMKDIPDSSRAAWHMIGHVQSRKARLVSENFDCVHSLDSVSLARKLGKFAEDSQRVLPVLLEFNLGGEESKTGWRAWDEHAWEGLYPEVEAVAGVSGLAIHGLMTMPPFSADPQAARGYFQQLRRLQANLARRFPAQNWSALSMGTSADYEVAVEEGATMVRIGQAILGPRQYAAAEK